MTPRVRVVPGHGSGHVVEVYAPIAATVDCAHCEGGVIETYPGGEPTLVACPECGGTGRVVVPEPSKKVPRAQAEWRHGPYGAPLILLLLASIGLLGGCVPPGYVAQVTPLGRNAVPYGVLAFTPPAQYRILFNRIVGQVGHTRVAFDDILWYRAPGRTFICAYGTAVCYGQWLLLPQDASGFTSAIILADAERGDSVLVGHELLHAILQIGGEDRHPRLFWDLGLMVTYLPDPLR